MSAGLPARANLEFVKKQSKKLHKAFTTGDAEAQARIRAHLPRAMQLSDAELRALDLSLQEAQHALACEYGFPKWEALLMAIEPLRFEDLGELPERAMLHLLRRCQQKDLAWALLGAPRELADRFLSKLTARVGSFVRSEMGFTDAADTDRIEAAQQRILDQALQMRERGWLTWPPFRETAALPTGSGRIFRKLDRLSTPLMELSSEKLLELLVGAAEVARREGIVALEQYLGGGPGTLLTEGLRLAVDGTGPELVTDLLETRAQTIVHGRRVRVNIAMEGWLSIHHGDNPALVQHRVEGLFVEDPEPPPFLEVAPPAEELLDRLRTASPAGMSPEEMVPFYRDLATLCRLRGLSAAQDLTDVIADPVLLAGIHASVVEKRAFDGVMEAMETRARQEYQELHRRHRMVICAVRSIQDGDNPRVVEEDVRKAGEDGVAVLAADGKESPLSG